MEGNVSGLIQETLRAFPWRNRKIIKIYMYIHVWWLISNFNAICFEQEARGLTTEPPHLSQLEQIHV